MRLPKLLSVEEVAAGIRRHPEVVRRQARDGRLPAEKIGLVWFFRPERLAEAGYPQFLPTMASSEVAETRAADPPTESLVRALGEAGLEALRSPQQDAIFDVVGRRLAEAGFSMFVFLLANGAGLRCAFRQLAEPDSDVEKVAGQAAVGTIIPFDRAPILRGVCTTLRAHYIGDADELVGRMAVAIPAVAANARRVSEILHMGTMIAAPLVVGDKAAGAIVVVGPGLRQADLPAVMLALGAELKTASPRGGRTIVADDFFLGLLTSALDQDEILTEIRIPKPGATTGGAYEKHAHPASRFALVGVAASITLGADGAVTAARIAFTGVGDRAARSGAISSATGSGSRSSATSRSFTG